jgi:hypothetical protein
MGLYVSRSRDYYCRTLINDHRLKWLPGILSKYLYTNEAEQKLNDYWYLAMADQWIRIDGRLYIEVIGNKPQLWVEENARAQYLAEQRLELNLG